MSMSHVPKIEKGIPLPAPKGPGSRGYMEVLRQMEAGDSALFPCAKGRSSYETQNGIRHAAFKLLPRKFTNRWRPEEGGVRCWRTE